MAFDLVSRLNNNVGEDDLHRLGKLAWLLASLTKFKGWRADWHTTVNVAELECAAAVAAAAVAAAAVDAESDETLV